MSSCTLLAPAKINLYLEILGDRPDHFHELAMVLQSITLADHITLHTTPSPEIQVHCSHPQVPCDPTNLAYRAAALMAEKFPAVQGQYGGVEIHIEKNIPVGAGLAGGSTDGAAVLVGLDALWQLGLSQTDLESLAAELGSDMPFCLKGGTVLATGRGEVLSPLPSLEHLFVVLAKYRSLLVSTPWAYKTYRQQFQSQYIPDLGRMAARHQQVRSGPMVGAIAQRNGQQISQLLHNDLEKVVLPAHPHVQQLRQRFGQRSGILGTMMSGSGPTVFGLCESEAVAKQVAAAVEAEMNDPDLDFWVTRFSATGIQLVKS
jgi:4-diphosphocytidyl-2-C-methyl-D-erythritol kinase